MAEKIFMTAATIGMKNFIAAFSRSMTINSPNLMIGTTYLPSTSPIFLNMLFRDLTAPCVPPNLLRTSSSVAFISLNALTRAPQTTSTRSLSAFLKISLFLYAITKIATTATTAATTSAPTPAPAPNISPILTNSLNRSSTIFMALNT